jgi:hypothetical protein
MARKGRDLEKLIALLEMHLGKEGIKVTSPDYIQGRKSKSWREVDISLRSQIGSSDILVIVECRDRQGTEDVTWIEQLASKSEDVGADKAVAVSSTGFTSGAINLATAKNIELRTLEEIDLHEILLWFCFKEITCFNRSANFTRVSIELVAPDSVTVVLPPEVLAKLKPRFDIHAQIFRRKIDGSPASFWDIWAGAHLNNVYSEIEPAGSKVNCHINLNFTNKQDCFQLITTSGVVDIKQVKVDAELWIEVEKKPLKSVRFYRDDNKIIAQSAEFEIGYEGETLALELHKYPQSGEQVVSLRKKETISKAKSLKIPKEDNVD